MDLPKIVAERRRRRLPADRASKARRAGAALSVALVAGLCATTAITSRADAGTAVATMSGLACNNAVANSQTYTNSTWGQVTVPAGVTAVSFTITGGGGGAGTNGADGGAGAVVEGTMAVTPGQVLWAQVGCGGTDANSYLNWNTLNAGGFNRGGASEDSDGGGGGGSTGLCLGTSTAACGSGQMIAIAAGGGGGSKNNANTAGGNGNAGATIPGFGGTVKAGGAGAGTGANTAGLGGSTVGGTGGAGGSAPNPNGSVMVDPPAPADGSTLGKGGNGDNDGSGGGGGGGLAGGGGGRNGGGGAGSSWVKSSVTGVAWTTAASPAACGTTGIGVNPGAGADSGVRGCHGDVAIAWVMNSSSLAFTTAPSPTAKVGGALATQPVIRAMNGSTPIGNESITLTYSGTSNGTLPCAANPVVTDANGYAAFSGCSFNAAGSYTLTATNTDTGGTATTGAVVVTENNTWTYTPTLPQTCGTNESVAVPPTATSVAVTVAGGGGGSGARAGGATSGAGGRGQSATLSGPIATSGTPAIADVSRFNYQIGCGGGGGNFSVPPTSGGTAGTGFAAGGAGGAAAAPGGKWNSSGGGGGGASAACLSNATGHCGSATVPLVVAGGGGGGGGARGGTAGSGGAGNAGTNTTIVENWYSGSVPGRGRGGHGGGAGSSGGGGGGGGGIGGAGLGTSAGSGGANNTPGGPGGGTYPAPSTPAPSSGSGGVGGTGAAAAVGDPTGGGGGGGGFTGGGGGAANGNSQSGTAAGGGSGSSWGNTALGAPTFDVTGGAGAGTATGDGQVSGTAGSQGSATVTFSGTGINVANPGAQTSPAGSTVSLPILATYSTLDGKISCCAYSATGLPAGMSINPTTGVISGTAQTTAGTTSVTVTVRTTANTILPAGAQFSTSTTFNWTFTGGAAAKLVFLDEPSSSVASGAVMGSQPTVAVQDAFGNQVVSSVPVTLTLMAANGVDPSTAGTLTCSSNPVTTAGGQASFDGCTITGGHTTYRLKATSGSLTSVLSGPITIGGVNRPPASSAQSGSTVRLGQTVTYTIPVSDPDGYTANGSGDEAAPVITPVATAGGAVSCSGFVADAAGSTNGSVSCAWNVGLTSTVGTGTLWSFTVTDHGGAVSASYAVTGSVQRRALVGNLSCVDEQQAVTTQVSTGDPVRCSVNWEDASTVGSSAGGTTAATVTADAPQPLSAGATTTVASSLAGTDFFLPTGDLATTGSCDLAAASTSASCALSPLVARAGGVAVLSATLGGDDGVHENGSVTATVLTVATSCTPKVLDGKSVAAPNGTYVNDSKFDFYAYNLGCGAATSELFGLAYGIGPEAAAPFNGDEAYLSEVLGPVDQMGFAQWNGEVHTDPGEDVKVRFFGTDVAPTEWAPASVIVTEVNWLSGINLISIDGIRQGPDGRVAQTISFPGFVAERLTSVTLAATSSEGLPVAYEAFGPGCTVSGNVVTFGSDAGELCQVKATQPGNSDVLAAPPVWRNVKVAKSAQTITFDRPVDAPPVDTVLDVAPLVSASSGLPVTLSTVGAGCTVSGSAVTFVSSSACKVEARQAGDAQWAAAPVQTWSLRAARKAQTITFPAPAAPVAVGTVVDVATGASASSGLAISWSVKGGCAVSGPGQVTITSRSTCVVRADQSGDSVWDRAPQVAHNITTTA